MYFNIAVANAHPFAIVGMCRVVKTLDEAWVEVVSEGRGCTCRLIYWGTSCTLSTLSLVLQAAGADLGNGCDFDFYCT